MIRSTLTFFIAFGLLTIQNMSAQSPEPPCSPNIVFWKLLEGVRIDRGGHLSLGDYYATCLPQPAKESNSAYAFDPDEGRKLTSTVKTAGGKVLFTCVWYVEKVSTLWTMERYKVIGGPEAVKLLEPGEYLLEFAIEGKPFRRFPFTVSKMKNDDIYESGDLYFLDGAWNEYAGLSYVNVNRYLQFNVWLRSKSGVKKKSTPYELRLVRESDKKVMAVSDENAAIRLEPAWNQYKMSFRPLKNEKGEQESYEFKPIEVLKNDGRYTVHLTVDGQLYGDYPFVVKGGKIQEPDEPPADPLMRIGEGGWVKRKGSAK